MRSQRGRGVEESTSSRGADRAERIASRAMKDPPSRRPKIDTGRNNSGGSIRKQPERRFTKKAPERLLGAGGTLLMKSEVREPSYEGASYRDGDEGVEEGEGGEGGEGGEMGEDPVEREISLSDFSSGMDAMNQDRSP